MTTDNTTTDFSNYDDETDFEPSEISLPSLVVLPPGKYDVVIDDIIKERGDDGKARNYVVKMHTIDPENPGVDLRRYLYLSEKALPWTVQDLIAILGGPLPSGFGIPKHAELFVGRPARVEVKTGVWQERERTEVVRFLPAGPASTSTPATSTGKPASRSKPANMF